jgi:putative endonuclease
MLSVERSRLCGAPLRKSYALHRVREKYQVPISALGFRDILACPGATTVEMLFFVYILANRPCGVLYVGVTNDLSRRIMVHKGKLAPGFTKTHGIVHLVYYEEYASVIEARARERAIKRWRREWKFAPVEKTNPAWRDLADEIP